MWRSCSLQADSHMAFAATQRMCQRAPAPLATQPAPAPATPAPARAPSGLTAAPRRRVPQTARQATCARTLPACGSSPCRRLQRGRAATARRSRAKGCWAAAQLHLRLAPTMMAQRQRLQGWHKRSSTASPAWLQLHRTQRHGAALCAWRHSLARASDGLPDLVSCTTTCFPAQHWLCRHLRATRCCGRPAQLATTSQHGWLTMAKWMDAGAGAVQVHRRWCAALPLSSACAAVPGDRALLVSRW